MKKVMFLMAVAGMFAFAACNNNAKTTEEPKADEQTQIENPVVDDQDVAQDDQTLQATDENIDAEQNTENNDAAAEQK